MKILLLANTDWYLYNFRLQLASALVDHGDDVTLVSPPGQYSARLQQAGFRWLPLGFSRRGVNPLKETGIIRRLTALYRTEQPDVVNHFTIKPVLYGSIAARTAGVRRVVNSVTGLGYVFADGGWKSRLLRVVVETIYRYAVRDTQIIFQNPADLAEFTRRRLAKTEQCHLIRGSGINLLKFTPLPLPQGRPVVLFPGRLLWAKGVGEFVEAARRVCAKGVQARFVVVGTVDDGNPDFVPQEQMERWQGEGVIEWWGWQESMPEVYASASIVCFPSYYGEGVSRVLLEAAASGRAIVTSDIPGCREAVVDGKTGMVVPARNVPALVQALADLIADPERCQQMGLAGRRLVETEFSAERVIKETLAVYFSTQG